MGRADKHFHGGKILNFVSTPRKQYSGYQFISEAEKDKIINTNHLFGLFWLWSPPSLRAGSWKIHRYISPWKLGLVNSFKVHQVQIFVFLIFADFWNYKKRSENIAKITEKWLFGRVRKCGWKIKIRLGLRPRSLILSVNKFKSSLHPAKRWIFFSYFSHNLL